MKLSVLICTLPGSYRPTEKANLLFDDLTSQAHDKPVEVLYLGDNKSMSVGRKRNILMSIARGRFICFVDDDDKVSPDYIDTMLEYTELNKDCVTIGVILTRDGQNPKEYDYNFHKNANFRRRSDGKPMAGRMPNHLCLWRKTEAIAVQFPDINLSEDHRWAENQILRGYDVEHRSEKIIYHYDFVSNHTQTRRR